MFRNHALLRVRASVLLALASLTVAANLSRATNVVHDVGQTAVGGSSASTVALPVTPAHLGIAPIGVGTQPAVSLSTNAVAFGAVPIGSYPAQSVTLTNTGTGALTIFSLQISNTTGYAFYSSAYGPGSCSGGYYGYGYYGAIAPGGSCIIQVSFYPAAIGQFSGTISVITNAPNSPQTVALTGSGTPALNLLADLSGVQFIAQNVLTQSTVGTATIYNLTGGAVTNISISIAGANPADFLQVNTCPSSLAQGATCTVSIVFYPQSFGNRTGTLAVASNLGPVSYFLSSTGVLSGAFEIVNGLSGKALDLSGGSEIAGTPVQQNSLSGLSQQQWTLVPLYGGFYEIVNALSGRVLDVTGESSANGATLQEWDYVGGANQQWQLVLVDDVHYKILNRLSGKVLDVTGGSTANGTTIQQWDYVGDPQQLWTLVPAVSYTIQNTLSADVLDISSGSSSSGTGIQQSTVNGTKQQQWQFIPVGSGFYAITDLLTGKVLDVTGESTADGAPIEQRDYLGGANQQWQLVPVNSVAPTPGGFNLAQPTFNFQIVNRLSGKVLDNTGSSTSSGTGIQQWEYLGGVNQQWQLTSSATYLISSAYSDRVLDVPGGSTANGTPIQQWTSNGFLQQQWQILPAGGGYYAIINSLTGKALEVSGSSTADGAPIDQADFTSAPNQLWQFVGGSQSEWFSSPYSIVNKGSGKVLDNTGFSLSDGTLMQQWENLGGNNQQWYVSPPPSSSP